MTTAPYIALVADYEVFDPIAHARRDLFAFELEIPAADMELPRASMRVRNPRVPLSALPDHRVLISEAGRLLFDGRLSSVPRGTVDRTIYLEAIARPVDLDQRLAVLAEDLKVAPYWDPLFVPEGGEDDWAEILAARIEVLAYSRTGGVASVDALSGASTLALSPLPSAGSVRYDRQPVAPEFGIHITARWQQIGQQTFSRHPALDDVTTANWRDLIEKFPRQGSKIGSAFTVTRSSAARRVEFFDEVEKKHSRVGPAPGTELDPAFGGYETQHLIVAPLDLELTIEHEYQVNRTETCEFSFPVELQEGAAEGDAEIETIALRDISERATAPSWQSEKNYAAGDEVVDGSNVYAAREDHYSGEARDPARWSLIGEASYVSSRRVSSFLRSTRGAAALDHAVERVRARARIASRCVTVDFDAAMPDPWLVTEDCQVSIAHALIPGGSITGRLVAYSLHWSGGRRWMTGTIAACVGTGAHDSVEMAVEDGSPVNVQGRISVEVENDGEAQAEAFVAGNTPSPTRITIRTTPAPTGDFEHAVAVSTSGSVGVPQGAVI